VAVAFGRYLLQRKLAEGGMAELFLARQGGMEGFEKLVVVKRILPSLSTEASFVKMFLNEARVAARLNHPNVVQIFDLGRIDNQYFIAMEFIHGEDIRSIVGQSAKTKKRPPPAFICRVLADTLAGLHYAHERKGPDGQLLGLVHRDVSPHNIIVTFEGGVKLVDFGIAKATRTNMAEQTAAGLFKGKFAYMAPEQTRGGQIDRRSDIFAVGILLWELITWTRLFKRDTEMATLVAVAEDPIPKLSTFEPSVPPELERIVEKALARPLDDRYATAEEMRSDLEALIRTQLWEADSLATARFLKDLFADKLKALDEDLRARGSASLEDFLLKIEETTQIRWMNERKTTEQTPSTGLPEQERAAQPSEEFDDGPTTEDPSLAQELIARARATMQEKRPVRALSDEQRPTVPFHRAAGLMDPNAKEPPPVEQPPSDSQPAALPPPPSTPSLHGVHSARGHHQDDISTDRGPPTAEPHARTLMVDGPVRTPSGQPAVSASEQPPPGGVPYEKLRPYVSIPQMNVPGVQPELVHPDAYNLQPSAWRRVLVAGSFATGLAAFILTIALWPTGPSLPVVSLPALDASLSAFSAVEHHDLAAQSATLDIIADAPATITVDGLKQPFGSSALVQVSTQGEHTIIAERPGHPPTAQKVSGLAPGEKRPIKLSVK
jgi:serine/threonine protein kinase